MFGPGEDTSAGLEGSATALSTEPAMSPTADKNIQYNKKLNNFEHVRLRNSFPYRCGLVYRFSAQLDELDAKDQPAPDGAHPSSHIPDLTAVLQVRV